MNDIVYLVWRDNNPVENIHDRNLIGVATSLTAAQRLVVDKWKEWQLDGGPNWHYIGFRMAFAYDGNGFKWRIMPEKVYEIDSPFVIKGNTFEDTKKEIDVKQVDAETIGHYSKSLDDKTIRQARIVKMRSGNYRLAVGLYENGRAKRETVITVNEADRNLRWNTARMWVDEDIKELPEDFASSVESYRPSGNARLGIMKDHTGTVINIVSDDNIRNLTEEDWAEMQKHYDEIGKILKKANESNNTNVNPNG